MNKAPAVQRQGLSISALKSCTATGGARRNEKLDKDEGIRTLLAWFGNRCFRVNKITDDRLQEIAELIGAYTKTTQGTRIQLGKRLTAMNGYQCSTAPNLGATLTAIVIPKEVDPRPGVYRIEYR